MFARQVLMIMVSVLAVSSSQASSLLDQMAGRYTREGAVESMMNIEDEVIEGHQIRQVLAITPIKNSASARVSFYVGSGTGSQASCSGEEIFHISENGKSLFFGADLNSAGVQPDEFDGACSMTLNKTTSGSVVIRSSVSCQIEMCGAGGTINGLGQASEFVKANH